MLSGPRPAAARLICLAAAASIALAAPASAEDAAPEPAPEAKPREPERIAEGVAAAGLDLGGLTVAEAAGRLERRFGRRARRPVAVRVAGRRFRLEARRARLALDSVRTAKRALRAGRKLPEGPPAGESTPSGGARPRPLAEVGLAISWSRPAVRRWVLRVERRVERPARGAQVRIGIAAIARRRSRTGVRLDGGALLARIEAAFANPARSRLLRRPVARLYPAVSDRDLVARYPVILTVDRHSFKLRLFKRLRLRRTYPIALGAAGYDTPAGFYRVQSKQVDPAWTAPKKAWAGAYAGRTVPGGAPDNPLKARWLGLANGIGIHGTAEEWSIGTRASHGCIRMRVADVKRLYKQVPAGTPVRVSR